MTFDGIVQEVKDRLNLTSTEATTRIGREVNTRYRRVTSSLQLQVARRVTAIRATTTAGQQTLTFTGIEKIDRVYDSRSGTNVFLDEVSNDALRRQAAGTGDPAAFAIELMGPNFVTIRLDIVPQTTYDLFADGLQTASDLSGSQVPQIPESFHDILVEGVVADELRKAQKLDLARDAMEIYQQRMSELRMFIAKSVGQKIRQGESIESASSATGSGGTGANSGGQSYTQTGLITFDRAALAPFAVANTGAAYVPNLRADKVHVSATSRVLGRVTAGAGDSEELTLGVGVEFNGSAIQRSALTGDVTASAGSNATTIAAHAVTLAKMAQLASNAFLGNNAGAASDVLALTPTQATALLNAAVGDSGSGGTKGLVPAPGAGDAAANKYLKADATWATVPLGTKLSVVSKSALYTAATTDDVILCNGSFTVTLYTAVGHGGNVIIIKNIGTGSVVIDGNSTETIDGSLTATMSTQYQALTLVSDGSNWNII